MKITCGPATDLRTVTIELPYEPQKIGVFVSGGIDSAILYYILLGENRRLGNIHQLVPFSILRKEGSKHFAKLVIAHTHASYNLPYSEPIIVGDTELSEDKQVESGVKMVLNVLKFNQVYTGLIEQLPQHMVNWAPIPYKETEKFRAPFSILDKSHIIDIVAQLNQSALFYITHSCSSYELGRCNTCNGCNERSWGFEQLGIIDPGTI